MSLHPLVLAAIIGVGIAFGALVIAWLARSGGVRVLMIGVALLGLLPAGFVFVGLHPELVDGRYWTYKAFYQEIRVGMTRTQVLAAMARRYPAEGPRKAPIIISDTPEDLGFFMNPETSREPNCEGIFLSLEQGRVTAKRYSAD